MTTTLPRRALLATIAALPGAIALRSTATPAAAQAVEAGPDLANDLLFKTQKVGEVDVYYREAGRRTRR